MASRSVHGELLNVDIFAPFRLVGLSTSARIRRGFTPEGCWSESSLRSHPQPVKPPAWTKYNGADCPPMVFNSESAAVNDPIRDQRLAIFQVVS
jgi:hypothetical protein